ncbi:MAG: hypothetical protein JWP81_3289 [Ferruginibacter sp.]|nr:hypothetical protein [Ferruginibacter sp.]
MFEGENVSFVCEGDCSYLTKFLRLLIFQNAFLLLAIADSAFY